MPWHFKISLGFVPFSQLQCFVCFLVDNFIKVFCLFFTTVYLVVNFLFNFASVLIMTDQVIPIRATV